jgi:glycosyltransferase A (GT-A) superfamily protein (DUF2064 family)
MTMLRSTTALILMCTPPRHGAGLPSRLASAVGPRLACLLEWGMLECAMEDLLGWPGPRFLAVERDDVDWAQHAVDGRVEILVPRAGSLGGRIMELDATLRDRGEERVIICGTGAPAMSSICLGAAAAAMGRGASVIGSTPDGRTALLGTARGWPAVDALQFNRSTASSRFAACCRRAGHEIAFVNPGVSVSCAADLEACCRELDGDSRPSRASLQFLLAALVMNVGDHRQRLREVQASRCDRAPALVI